MCAFRNSGFKLSHKCLHGRSVNEVRYHLERVDRGTVCLRHLFLFPLSCFFVALQLSSLVCCEHVAGDYRWVQ